MTSRRGVSLVTGATGFVGSAVVAHILEQGHIARCVVRGATDGERTARLRAALDRPAAVAWDRIEVVPGDLAKERLGLSVPDFAALGRDVDRVIHCGARVNMSLPYGSLYETNVRATEDMLDLAHRGGAAFAYVGSIAAVARSVTTEPFELMAPVTGGYAQSKWSADRLVSVAHQEGRVRAVILRPGRVTADARTARFNPDDLLETIIRICTRMGTAPILDTSVRLSPLDWVTALIVALSDRAGTLGRAYHLIAEERLPWTGVLAALRGGGYTLDEAPYDTWRTRVISAGRSDPDIARVGNSLRHEGLSFDDRPTARPVNAVRALTGAYPGLPSAAELLQRTIVAWQEAGVLPHPAAEPAGLMYAAGAGIHLPGGSAPGGRP